MLLLADILVGRHYFLPYFIQIYITTIPEPKLHKGKTTLRRKSIRLG
jgi:hypothetical protein